MAGAYPPGAPWAVTLRLNREPPTHPVSPPLGRSGASVRLGWGAYLRLVP